MSYFVTGATGFIGRSLVATLLTEREGDIHVLVRPSSRARLDDFIDRMGTAARERIKPVLGDLTEPQLGVDADWIEAKRGTIAHAFHLAAIYDLTASGERNEETNVLGTAHTLELLGDLKVGRLHHISSVAVAGDYEGTFTEEMFDEGQSLPTPYHRTKFESEALVRSESSAPWRIYRPSIVVGDSQTGEIDKVDGPYFFFKTLQRLAATLPSWAVIAGPDLGATNIVPVDYVARALDHIAHLPELDGRAFHLVDPTAREAIDVLNTFARAAGAPRIVRARGAQTALTAASAALDLPPLRRLRDRTLHRLGIPPQILGQLDFKPRFDCTQATAALAASDIRVPELEQYVDVLWRFWERRLDRSPPRNRNYARVLEGKTVVITGASSGIGKEAASMIAQQGGIPILIARSLDKLEAERDAIVHAGGEAYAYGCDLSDLEAIDELATVLLDRHDRIHVLVNNAGRSIRRSLALSYDRFHDFERTIRLNYLGAIKLTMGLLPHMQERGGGHITNISSIGVQTAPPRFSAYVASKAALDAWSRVVSAEVIGDGVTFTTIHMPLVRTPMIAPTKMYDNVPTISTAQAADMICRSIVDRPKDISTTLGTFGEVSYALSPKVVDQILHAGYRVFPDSAAARGEVGVGEDEQLSMEQIVMANALRGIHW